MMKYLLIALATTAVWGFPGDPEDEASIIDNLLDEDMSLPCTPKPCIPVCKPVTKYLTFGSFKLPYTENVCKPDAKCLATAAACIKTLQAAMVDADKKSKALEAASKAKNSAHATKAQKDKAAAARKAEAASAATALGLAKAAFEAAEKEAANAKAAKESAAKIYTAKAAVMDARLKSYEQAQQSHKNAVAAYDGAKSAAARAAADYAAAVKAHCDAEAQHAAAVKNIGHGHLAQKKCASTGPGNNFFAKAFPGGRNNWNGEVGFKFTTKRGFQVSALGRSLPAGGSLRGTSTVSIWDPSTRRKVASVAVGPSSPKKDGYAYAQLSSAVSLSANKEYRISEVTTHGMDKWNDASDGSLSNYQSAYATFRGGVYCGGSNCGYPTHSDGATRRPGMVTFYMK
jgi:hypothetical protein